MASTGVSKQGAPILAGAPPTRPASLSSLPAVGGPSVTRDQFVPSRTASKALSATESLAASPAPAVRPVPPRPTLKERIQENRERLGRVLDAQKQAGDDPVARAAWQREAATYLDWLATLERTPSAPVTPDYMIDAWMVKAGEQILAARGVTTPAVRLSAYQECFAEFHARPTRASRALLAAATTGVLPQAPMPLTATSQEIRTQLAPAVLVLAASKSPVAQDLALKIQRGDIAVQMVDGQAMGTQFYAVVSTSTIKLSNGEKGPDFFRMSPPYQAATLLHEYTHVKQKEHVGGFVNGLKGNLLQRTVSLSGRLIGDDERLDAKGRALNGNEQEAYRAEKAFLVEMGLGQQGFTPEDAGALVGIDSWLEAAR